MSIVNQPVAYISLRTYLLTMSVKLEVLEDVV